MSEGKPEEIFSNEDDVTSTTEKIMDANLPEPDVHLEDVYEDSSIFEDKNQISYGNPYSGNPKNEVMTLLKTKYPDLNIKSTKQTIQPKPPRIVFIVPYRDRLSHYKLFSEKMKTFLRNSPPYKILYIHQTDTRSFNRGAMKNIGFLVVKKLFPDDYKNMTLVFNDIDTMPTNNIVIKYETQKGTIKHFYGFEHTLGGIVSINAVDFESINGFPNFWAWGYEDNMLQIRAKDAGIKIDRSVFYKIMDPNIIHLSDTFVREVNKTEFDRYLQNTSEGIESISNLDYKVNLDTGFIDVLTFDTKVEEVVEKRVSYDLRNGPAPFKDVSLKKRAVPKMKMHF